jgi:hypothetical protein
MGCAGREAPPMKNIVIEETDFKVQKNHGQRQFWSVDAR